jgi:hypothetical protein
VRAARKQCDQDRQVPRREQPLVGLVSSRRGRTRDEAQPAALGEIVQMLDANPCEVHDLCISEDFLTCFDGYHGIGPLDLGSHFNLKELVDDSKVVFGTRRPEKPPLCFSSQLKQPVPHKCPNERPRQAKASRHHQKQLGPGDIYSASHVPR